MREMAVNLTGMRNDERNRGVENDKEEVAF